MKTKKYKNIEYTIELLEEEGISKEAPKAYMAWVLEPFKCFIAMPTAKMAEDKVKKAIDFHLQENKKMT